MDEEIIEALTKASAIDQESGLTIEKLMEATGKDLDTVVMNVRRLRRDGKAQVSNESQLANNANHAWPSTQGIEVTGEAVAQAKREWKEQNHKPILVWLGAVVLNELEEKRKADEFHELIRTVVSRPSVHIGGDNYGQAAAGQQIHQEQQATTQTLRDSDSSKASIQSPSTEEASNPPRPWLEKLYWLAGIVMAALAVWAFIANGK